MNDSAARRQLAQLVLAWEDYRHEDPAIDRMVGDWIEALVSWSDDELGEIVTSYKDIVVGVRYAGDQVQ